MRKITLCLVLLALVACQDVIVQNWTGAYTTGEKVTKTYNNANWANEKDVAVYGWFKISSAYPRDQWSTIFHLTSNDASFVDLHSPGDRVLSLFMINNILHTPSYNLGVDNNAYQNQDFVAGDVDKWNFFYVAYGSAAKRRFVYYNLAASGVKTQQLENINHNPSTFYRIFVGQSVNYKYFQGQLYRVTLDVGATAYREKNFEQITVINPVSPPNCPVVFTGCGYSGVATNVCENKPEYDVSKIKSVYLPDRYRVTIYDQANYAGKKVQYAQSIDCITQFNWAMLVDEKKIIISDEVSSLRRN